MPVVHCFTSATFAYLDRVRVLGETLRRHHPDWIFSLVLSDQEPEGFEFDIAREPIDRLVRIEELGIPNLSSWMFEHDIVELCTAVKGDMLCRLLYEGADKVIYLDPDIAVFSSLAPILDSLNTYNVVLTPHQVAPDVERAAILDNEIGSLKYGIYNLGFVAVANRPEGRRFAGWWRDRLRDFCFDDVPNGLFTDQRWCDHVPALFDGVRIERDMGFNVASWNLSQRRISIGTEGTIFAGSAPLRFFHFTKVTWVGEIMLERYSGKQIEVFELLRWYRLQLEKNKAHGVPAGWWAYDHYHDGRPIPKTHRIAYRNSPSLRQEFPYPFRSDAGWLDDGRATSETAVAAPYEKRTRRPVFGIKAAAWWRYPTNSAKRKTWRRKMYRRLNV